MSVSCRNLTILHGQCTREHHRAHAKLAARYRSRQLRSGLRLTHGDGVRRPGRGGAFARALASPQRGSRSLASRPRSPPTVWPGGGTVPARPLRRRALAPPLPAGGHGVGGLVRPAIDAGVERRERPGIRPPSQSVGGERASDPSDAAARRDAASVPRRGQPKPARRFQPQRNDSRSRPAEERVSSYGGWRSGRPCHPQQTGPLRMVRGRCSLHLFG